MDILKKRLKDLRTDADINQWELADALNVGRSSISFFENGREPDLDTIFAYADYFHVSVPYLLGLTNEPNPKPESTISAISTMRGHAEKRDQKAFSAADIEALAKAFSYYYVEGNRAGDIPMRCATEMIRSLTALLRALATSDWLGAITAGNDLAHAGLLSSDVLAASLPGMTSISKDNA